MKTLITFCSSLLLACLMLLGCTTVGKQQENEELKEHPKIVLAYVTSWSTIVPDASYLTHINYAFGHVNDTFDGVRIDNENRLRSLVALKADFPELKILLSVGGWGSGRFSEMAANSDYRRSFAKDCQRIVADFGLDGIDIDWEYPTSDVAKISASTDDTENFTLLMQDIRKEIGVDKLLTLATAFTARYIDFKAIDQFIDFVNIMSYDMGRPPFHHSSLYASENTGNKTVQNALQAHIDAGVSPNKLVLGIPFYGRGNEEIGNFIDYKKIIELTGFEEKWDEMGSSPYLVDKDGQFACGFENARSIALKCQYIKDEGLLGAMYWEYNGDDENGTLRKAVYNGLNKKE